MLRKLVLEKYFAFSRTLTRPIFCTYNNKQNQLLVIKVTIIIRSLLVGRYKEKIKQSSMMIILLAFATRDELSYALCNWTYWNDFKNICIRTFYSIDFTINDQQTNQRLVNLIHTKNIFSGNQANQKCHLRFNMIYHMINKF